MKELTKIKKILKTKKLSVSQLAVALGYRTPNTIHAWLTNKKIPGIAIKRVRDFLGR